MRFRYLRRLISPVLCLLACIALSVPAAASDGRPDAYSSHGALTVTDDGALTDVFGHSFTLKGMTVDTDTLGTEFLTQETFLALKDQFLVNTVRIPVTLKGEDGYCTGGDMARAVIRSNVYAALNAAIYQDMYVILSWELTGLADIRDYRDEFHTFFEDIAAAYRDFPNIIYEIGSGEDDEQFTWEDALPYLAELTDCIRYYSPDSLVIVGLPDEGRDLASAEDLPVSRENILYGYRVDPMDEDVVSDLDQSLSLETLPLIVTGFSPADESGEILWQTAGTFMSMLDFYGTSFCYGRLSEAILDSSLPAATIPGPDSWSTELYTRSGSWLSSVMNGDLSLPEYIPPETQRGDETSPSTVGGDYWAFDNGVSVVVSGGNYWSDGTACYASYEIEIVNNSPAALSDWNLRLYWDCPVGDWDYWSCQIAGEGSSRLIGPADYNRSIPAGSCATLGIVVSSDGFPTLNSLTLE